MSRPQSPVDVVNIALDYLGQNSVTSITDNTQPHAILMGRHYDMVRRKLLREYPWNWAKRRKLLLRSRTPEFDFADAYVLPGDYLRILNFGGPTSATTNNQPPGMIDNIVQYFDIEDNPAGSMEILCNNQGQSTLAARYIADIEDVNKFDALFVNLLALHVALNVAYQITKNKDDVQRINELLKIELPMALSIFGQENPPTIIEQSKFINARLRGTTGNDAVASQYTTFGNNWS